MYWKLFLRCLESKTTVQTGIMNERMTHAFTIENHVIFEIKRLLEFIELKYFRTIALNDYLISEACSDPDCENDCTLELNNGFSSIKMKYFTIILSICCHIYWILFLKENRLHPYHLSEELCYICFITKFGKYEV